MLMLMVSHYTILVRDTVCEIQDMPVTCVVYGVGIARKM